MTLDDRRLDRLSSRLSECPHARVPREELWKAFVEAFPARPTGSEEQLMFVAVLEALADRGVLTMPSRTGRRWARVLGVSVPESVDRHVVTPTRDPSWRGFPWHPSLAWVADLPVLGEEQRVFLRRVHEGLVRREFAEAVPRKRRSLELCDDEKRLDRWMDTKLFAPGRLSPELLGIAEDLLPLVWEEVGDAPAALIFENADSFTYALRWLRVHPESPWGVVVFGDGNRICRSLVWLREIGHPLERIAYVGDLDRDGLAIAHGARRTARKAGLPDVEPASFHHAQMLAAAARMDRPIGWPHEKTRDTGEDERLLTFLLPEQRDAVRAILAAGRRIPEEILAGPEWAELGLATRVVAP